jgi:hypothetical protein
MSGRSAESALANATTHDSLDLHRGHLIVHVRLFSCWRLPLGALRPCELADEDVEKSREEVATFR